MTLHVDILLSFLWAFMISVFAIPSIVRVAHVKNLLDEPNFRTVHASLTPRLGGLAIFAGFMSAITIFGDINHSIQRVLAGCMVLFFIGLKDDIISISVFKKFFVQVLATGIIMFIGDIRITSFQGFLGIHELEDGISYGITFLVVVGITNAINLIDGLDGLAGSIIMIITLVFGYYFYISTSAEFHPYAKLAICLVGGIVGFLRYNMHKAIIFMGDTGSLVCGFLVAVLAIQFIEMRSVPAAPSLAVATLIIPVFDTARVFAVRILRGLSPFSPDKNHIHHILMRMGLNQLQTVLVLVVCNIVAVVIATTFAHLGDNWLRLVIGIVFLLSRIFLALVVRKHRIVQPQASPQE